MNSAFVKNLLKHRLLVLFISAFLIRLIGLNQSFWLDETTVGVVTMKYSIWDMLWYFTPYDFHPPFYYFFIKAWSIWFGLSEVAMRMPSVIFSLLSGLSIYFIGKRLKSAEVGFWAAAFFLFNPLVVYYSQEARMYMTALYFIVRSFELFLRVENPKERTLFDIFSLNAFLFLSFFTFYGSIFFIASIYFYLLYQKKYRTFFIILPGFILSVLVISPLLIRQLTFARQVLGQVENWTLVLGQVTAKNLLLIPMKFAIGRISFYPKWIYWAISALWTAIVVFMTFRGIAQNKKLAYFLIFPLICGVLISFITPMLQYFRFLYLVSIMSLLLAISVTTTHPVIFKPLTKIYPFVKYMLLIGFAIFSLVYTTMPAFHREDWRTLSKMLKLMTTEQSEVYGVDSVLDPLTYYQYGGLIRKMRFIQTQPPKNNKIFVLPYAAEIWGIDYKKILDTYRYRMYQDHVYRGLTIEEWVKY